MNKRWRVLIIEVSPLPFLFKALRNVFAGPRAFILQLPPLLALCFAGVLPCNAGMIVFHDLQGQLSVTDDTGRILSQSCSNSVGERCSLVVTGPQGEASLVLSNSMFFLREADSQLTSDFVLFCAGDSIVCGPGLIIPGTVEILFFSDDETGSLGGCTGCPPEDGTPQTSGTITWRNIDLQTVAVDTIKVESDVETVPEPSSILLLVAGMAIGGVLLVRQRHQNPRERFGTGPIQVGQRSQ